MDASYYKGTTVEEYLKKHRRQLVFENNSDRDNINKVAIKQATKQGYIECELGGVADLSYPDSKTRRGMVQDNGNTCPTITATETGVCRIEPKERFFNKDDVGSFYDYISVIFECLDCMKIVTKGEMKNEERYQKFRKILYVLWEEIRKETVQWKARGFWSIPEEEILQSRMYGKIQTNATKPDATWRIAHQTAQRINEKILKRTKCEICGKSGKLDVHHINWNWRDNSLKNLQVLCRSCHTKTHKIKNVCWICGDPMKGLGYCNKHYLRYKKYGCPLMKKKSQECQICQKTIENQRKCADLGFAS